MKHPVFQKIFQNRFKKFSQVGTSRSYVYCYTPSAPTDKGVMLGRTCRYLLETKEAFCQQQSEIYLPCGIPQEAKRATAAEQKRKFIISITTRKNYQESGFQTFTLHVIFPENSIFSNKYF